MPRNFWHKQNKTLCMEVYLCGGGRRMCVWWLLLPVQRRPRHSCWRETPNCVSVDMPGLRSQQGGSPAGEALHSWEDEWCGSENQSNMTVVIIGSQHHECDCSSSELRFTGSFYQSKYNDGAHLYLRFNGILWNYLYISPVCHPSGQLLSCKASDLQLIGIRPARFPFGWEVEERWSRVHIELQHKHKNACTTFSICCSGVQ